MLHWYKCYHLYQYINEQLTPKISIFPGTVFKAVFSGLVFQIWDLADPDGKGYLDKQVGNRFLSQCL